MSQKLPIELASLIHHVQLNEAGWWDKGIRQLILFVIWLNHNLSDEEILQTLEDQFSMTLDPSSFKRNVQSLMSSDVLIRTSGGNLKIVEHKLREFETAVTDAQEIDRKVKDSFCELTSTHCPSLNPDETWTSFTEKLLLPLIREIGAKTYELISGIGQDLEATASFATFVEQYPSEIRDQLRDTIVEFLDPGKVAVRSYILRNLNTYFFIEAGTLRQETIDALLKLTQRRDHTLRLFLDTNIVFSMLGFHNNPSNEAVQSLLSVVRQLSGKINPRCYVLPITVDETKRSLNLRRLELDKVRFSPNVASAAARFDELSGASRRFLETAAKAPRQLTPEEYFGPYLNNLLPILRGNGVELYNDNRITSYSTLPKVIDDVHEHHSFEQAKYKERAKSFDKITHDMVLWHFVEDLRPAHLEAPFEARDWIVTIDYRLLAFDEYKQVRRPFRMPVCIHPTALVQMLQFWVPRTPEFEKAVVESLQLPYIFEEFDPDAERVTILILQTVSKYEGIEHLPPQSIAHIVLNDALRQKMRVEPDEQKKIELIRDAIVQENIRLNRQLALIRQEAEQLRDELNEERDDKRQISDQNQREIDDYRRRTAATEEQLNEHRMISRHRDDKIANAIGELTSSQIQAARKQAKFLLRLITAIAVMFIVLIGMLLIKPVLDNWSWLEPYAWVVSGGISLIMVVLGIRLDPFSWRESLTQRLFEAMKARKLRVLKELERRIESDAEES